MENKRLIDITIVELETIIRTIIKDEVSRINSNTKELQDEEYLNIKEASKLIRYSVSSIYRKVSERTIPYHKVGTKRIVFKPKELFVWIDETKTRRHRS